MVSSYRWFLIGAVLATLFSLTACAPLPIPHHVNAVRIRGTVLDVNSGEPVKGADIVIDYGRKKTLRTKKDGTFEGKFGGNWRYIYLFALLPVDATYPPVHKEFLRITVNYKGDCGYVYVRPYLVEEPRWLSTSAHKLGVCQRIREINLGIIHIEAETHKSNFPSGTGT